jgi:hypothetical protein
MINDRRNVLIHCAAGAHRAATVTGAFLLWRRAVAFDGLENYMESRRTQVDLQCFRKLYELLQLFARQLAVDDEVRANRRRKKEEKAALCFTNVAETTDTTIDSGTASQVASVSCVSANGSPITLVDALQEISIEEV